MLASLAHSPLNRVQLEPLSTTQCGDQIQTPASTSTSNPRFARDVTRMGPAGSGSMIRQAIGVRKEGMGGSEQGIGCGESNSLAGS
jgi:hypothetical protein